MIKKLPDQVFPLNLEGLAEGISLLANKINEVIDKINQLDRIQNNLILEVCMDDSVTAAHRTHDPEDGKFESSSSNNCQGSSSGSSTSVLVCSEKVPGSTPGPGVYSAIIYDEVKDINFPDLLKDFAKFINNICDKCNHQKEPKNQMYCCSVRGCTCKKGAYFI